MSAISSRGASPDPRIQRTRAAVFQAATRLFLRDGYAETTMDDIAAAAGVARRSLYNNFSDKDALFTEIVTEVMTYAEGFARDLRDELARELRPGAVAELLRDTGRRLVLAIVRAEVIALRRLMISEARAFPGLARSYFDRAPGGVIATLTDSFVSLTRRRLLRAGNGRRAAEQFAYLVAGAPLDRAVLTGRIPPRKELLACANEGVRTFLARYR